MKKLLAKEIRLTANPLSIVFIAFALMTLFPGYPILMDGFFLGLGIFFTYQQARECDDVIYTVLLPVRKKDVVTSKYAFVIMIQMANFILCVLLTLLRMTVLKDAGVYLANVMMNANLMYLGFLLMVYACFNIFFLGGYFKTAYKQGVPFLAFSVATFIVITIGETLSKVPGGQILNATSGVHPVHAVVFAVGVLVYVVGTWASMIQSIKHFENIDL
ncbi:MAG: ABC-2 transporter permease [Lachnospiraceae bacterium]|nr:ABC-2 transporter permease [Candidatus Equihabitans merdae]